LPNVSDADGVKHDWKIENKYYSADLTLNLLDYSKSDEFFEEYEGIVVIPHADQV
jgi:hypothetical protein